MAGKYQWIGIGVTTVAVCVAVVHVAWPNMKIDTIAVVLLVVALLPWLGHLLESIEMPGGFKVKYRLLDDKIKQVGVEVSKANSTAQAAIGAAQVADLSTAPPTEETVRRLIDEYTRLRAQPGGPARTTELDRLFGAMVAVMPRIHDFDSAAALRTESDASRLTGYAYIFGRPDPARLTEVVAATVRETTPFVQYWGIRTVGALVDMSDASAVPESVVGQLREMLDRLEREAPASTRRHQLAGLLRDLRVASDSVTR